MKPGLFQEIVAMAFDTLRTQKMRSALTILGILVGVTSIVGMTSIVRGFDESLRDTIRGIGPNTIFIVQFSGLSFSSGEDFMSLMRRPSLTPSDGESIESEAATIQRVSISLGEGGPPTMASVYFDGRRTDPLSVIGTTDNYLDVNPTDMHMGRFFTSNEVLNRRNVVILGKDTYTTLFPQVDPIGKRVRINSQAYRVIGVLDSRPSPGGAGFGQDDLALIPHTAYQKQFGIRVTRAFRGGLRSIMLAAVPFEGVDRNDAVREVESIMRIRHGLRIDEPNDFDLMTQDSVLRLWDQISAATYLALVTISSIALLVGGIGVMAIMTISVKERTREIGTRRALGAERREILSQFLLESVFLTAVGGILGVICGSVIGLSVSFLTGFPVSLPWWSFAIGVGFSAFIGIVFGLFPAIRASGLDPIEALRYE